MALSQSAGARGDSFQATGSGFVPGESVTLSMAGMNLRSVLADANGAFAAELTVPSNAAFGSTQVQASGASQVLSAAFEVLAPASTKAPETGSSLLPRTGAALAGIASLGTVLVLLGAFAVLVTRRRRSAAA